MKEVLKDLEGYTLKLADGTPVTSDLFDEDFPDPDAVPKEELERLMALIDENDPES